MKKNPLSVIQPIKPAKKVQKFEAISLLGASITTGGRMQTNYRRRLNPSIVRKIRTLSMMHHVSHIIAFTTAVFFTFAWFLHYHVIPGMEARLTPEAKIMVSDLENRRLFEECNFIGWLNTPIDNLAYDKERCAKHLGFGSVIAMTFYPENSTRCFPRVEIHPCASPEVYANDKIVWDIVYVDYTQQYCPGTHGADVIYMDQKIVTPFLNEDGQDQLQGKIIPGVAFFFSCPHCIVSTGTIKVWRNKCFHGLLQLAPSVPLSPVSCQEVVRTTCNLFDSSLMTNIHNFSLSADVFPTYIETDVDSKSHSDLTSLHDLKFRDGAKCGFN